MIKNLNTFDNRAAYEAASLVYPNVSYLTAEDEVVWVKAATPPVHDYSQDYLTFVAEEDGTFKYDNFMGYSITNYSLDDGATWTRLANDTDTPMVAAGQKILWKGPVSLDMDGLDGMNWGTFSSTGRFSVEGNVLSLLYGDDFANRSMPDYGGGLFSSLFQGCEYLTSAEHLTLTSMELANGCYRNMFDGCSSLTAAPELPATTMGETCYSYMFRGCTSLQAAPQLPATTLAMGCYESMFAGCTSLTTAPVLAAETLADLCYTEMFIACKSLNSITCLATNITSAMDSTNEWVDSVASTGTFIKAASASWPSGTSGIPDNWTVQDYAG